MDREEARDVLKGHATDLHEKLKLMGHAHVILVLHSDPYANRLNPATFMILKMIHDKFADADGAVWRNVVFAYTRRDSPPASPRVRTRGPVPQDFSRP